MLGITNRHIFLCLMYLRLGCSLKIEFLYRGYSSNVLFLITFLIFLFTAGILGGNITMESTYLIEPLPPNSIKTLLGVGPKVYENAHYA